MPKPGTINNPNGRGKNNPNKITLELRDKIKAFLDGNFDAIQKDFDGLKPIEKLTFYERLLKFAVPVMSSQDVQINFDDLTDDQLNELINRLIKQSK